MNRIRIVFRFGSNLSQRSLVGLQSNRAWVSPCRLRQILPDDKYPALPVSGSNDFFILKKKKKEKCSANFFSIRYLLAIPRIFEFTSYLKEGR